jgi:hypothetical protein
MIPPNSLIFPKFTSLQAYNIHPSTTCDPLYNEDNIAVPYAVCTACNP